MTSSLLRFSLFLWQAALKHALLFQANFKTQILLIEFSLMLLVLRLTLHSATTYDLIKRKQPQQLLC